MYYAVVVVEVVVGLQFTCHVPPKEEIRQRIRTPVQHIFHLFLFRIFSRDEKRLVQFRELLSSQLCYARRHFPARVCGGSCLGSIIMTTCGVVLGVSGCMFFELAASPFLLLCR